MIEPTKRIIEQFFKHVLNIYFFRLNFSDTEIEIFCAKYDRDGNFEFTKDEIQAIEDGIGKSFVVI